MQFINFLMKDVVGTPALLIGLIAALGLILQKKPFTTVLGGFVKTATGYLIMQGGSSVVVGVLQFLGPVIQSAFGLTAPVTTGIPYDEFLATWGGYGTVAVALGFVVNILLARFTKFKFVYLTGHLMIFGSSCIMAGILAVFPTVSPWMAILATGLLLGVYWTLEPAYMNKHMVKVMKSEDLAYGHTSSIACWIAATVGKFVGKPEESTEDIQLPDSLSIFKDTVISLSVVLGLLCVVLALIAGPEAVSKSSGTTNYITYSLVSGFRFGAGISIMLYGVRLIIGELVPAFRGVAKVLVPGAKPALDCPIVFPSAPTAVLVGFLSSFTGFILSMLLIGLAGWGVVIPYMISIFFCGAASGVFGNSTGGWKGAIVGGLITGVLLAFGQLLTGMMLANAGSVTYVAMNADPDTHLLPWVGNLVGNLLKLIGR